MPPTRARTRRLLCSLAALLLAAASLAAGPGPDQVDGDLAYDAGRFAEALQAYERAEAAGALDGLGLYRLAYCLETVRRDTEASREAYERSVAALEEATAADGAGLEEHFYLVNAELNLGRPGEAREAALRATERVEAGAFAARTDGRALFRIGKLYRDAGLGGRSLEPYALALEAWQRDGDAPLPYMERVARFAFDQGDPGLSYRAFQILAGLGQPRALPTRLDLALKIRSGDLAGAYEAVESGRLGLPRTESRYLEQILAWAKMRDELGRRPILALPDGRSLIGLPSAEVQAAMTLTARQGLQAMGEAPLTLRVRRLELGTASTLAAAVSAGPVPGSAFLRAAGLRTVVDAAPLTLPGERWTDALTREEKQARRGLANLFYALGLEGIVRGADLRIWATQGRFAPLIFKPWDNLYRERHGIPRNGPFHRGLSLPDPAAPRDS